MSDQNIKKPEAAVAAKAGVWYTVCNFLFRGMAFITTPFFARLMAKEELGAFGNFASWTSILLVLTSFEFSQSIIRSKLEHKEDMDSYIWSCLSLSTLWTLLVFGVFMLFPDFFSGLMKIDKSYFPLMFFYLLAAPAFTMLTTRHRAFYRYKSFVLLTGVMTALGTLFALLLVFLMPDKLSGRIYGFYSPYVAIGFAVFIHLAIKGKSIKRAYWKYAAAICLPLIPHSLSLYLLSSSDIIIITRLCGETFTAVYSIAYSAYHIVTILFDSMNKAFAPWLLDNLHLGNFGEIRKRSKLYILIFLGIVFAVLLLVPEIILILGGKAYREAVWCMPPLIVSCVFQFIYTMYVNIEIYKKKTVWVSLATILATGMNIALNLILIPLKPERSYIIASYTTLTGYMLLFVLHYIIVRKMKMHRIYDTAFVAVVLGASVLTGGICLYLYRLQLLRYLLLGIYGAGLLYLGYKNRQIIKRVLFGKG